MSGVTGAQEGRKAYLIVNCEIVALPTATTRQDNDRYSRLQLATIYIYINN